MLKIEQIVVARDHMNRIMNRVLTLGSGSAIFVLSLTSPALAFPFGPHGPARVPEMNLGTAGNALLLLGGALLLVMDNYRNKRIQPNREK